MIYEIKTLIIIKHAQNNLKNKWSKILNTEAYEKVKQRNLTRPRKFTHNKVPKKK